MEKELRKKKKILEDFFTNFEKLKLNYKDYLTQLDIFKWDRLEDQIKNIEKTIQEKDLVNLKKFIDIIIEILADLHKKDGGYYYDKDQSVDIYDKRD